MESWFCHICLLEKSGKQVTKSALCALCALFNHGGIVYNYSRLTSSVGFIFKMLD